MLVMLADILMWRVPLWLFVLVVLVIWSVVRVLFEALGQAIARLETWADAQSDGDELEELDRRLAKIETRIRAHDELRQAQEEGGRSTTRKL